MALKSLAASGTCRVNCRCTRCVPTSITVWRKHKQRSDRSGSKSGFTAERFSIRRRRWPEVADRTRSTKGASENASDAHARAAYVKGAKVVRMDGVRGGVTSELGALCLGAVVGEARGS